LCASLTVEMEEFKSDGGGNVFNIECRGVQLACICVYIYIYIYSDGDVLLRIGRYQFVLSICQLILSLCFRKCYM